MRGEPCGWGDQVSGSCRPGGTAFSDTLRTAFTYGYDWLGRELSRSLSPDGGSDMRADGQVVHYGGDLPGLSQVLLRGENGSLYLFDGTTSGLVASGPLTQPLLYVYPSRG